MTDKEKIMNLLQTSYDGVITSRQVTKLGIHRSVLQKLVKDNIIYQFARGLYVSTNVWEDEFYLLQQKYKRGIYSYETALYLLGYSDRAPKKYTMTFPKGYNCISIALEDIQIKRVIPENYDFGIVEVKSPAGNPIVIYDLERTLCDVLRGNASDIQIINDAMKRYVSSSEKDINKLIQYAEKLHVKSKILRYLEVLL